MPPFTIAQNEISLQPRMDQHFSQIERIIKERMTSSRIRFMLQDVLDLRKVNGKAWWSKLKGLGRLANQSS